MSTAATKTTKTRKPKAKPERRITLEQPADNQGRNAIVQITVGKEVDHYFVSRIPSDFGTGFLVEQCNFDSKDKVYHVNLDGQRSTCDCPGHLHHGHCKHVDGTAALVRMGKL